MRRHLELGIWGGRHAGEYGHSALHPCMAKGRHRTDEPTGGNMSYRCSVSSIAHVTPEKLDYATHSIDPGGRCVQPTNV